MNRVRWILRLVRDTCLVPIAVLFPRNPRKIVFGAWSGKSFSCNPKYVFDYVCSRGGFNCIWIGDEVLRDQVLKMPGARFARRGSFVAYWHFFNARFMVSNVNCYSDIVWLPSCGKAIIIYTSHGYPDKKAENQLNGSGVPISNSKTISPVRAFVRRALLRYDKFLYPREAWSSASSPQGDKLRVEGQPSRLAMDRMLHAGTPRADYILAHVKDDVLKAKLREKYSRLMGVPSAKRWVVFAPTWRHDSKWLFSFSTSLQAARWQELFDKANAILIEKQHPKTVSSGFVNAGTFGPVHVVSQAENAQIDTQELLLASDVLITDYSSIYYDFYLMNRPVIHFTYDFEHAYTKDFGFDFDIREYGGGPFAYTEDELMKFMAMNDRELLSLRNEKTKDQLSYETGHACEAYYELIKRLAKQ